MHTSVQICAHMELPCCCCCGSNSFFSQCNGTTMLCNTHWGQGGFFLHCNIRHQSNFSNGQWLIINPAKEKNETKPNNKTPNQTKQTPNQTKTPQTNKKQKPNNQKTKTNQPKPAEKSSEESQDIYYSIFYNVWLKCHHMQSYLTLIILL